MGPLAEPLGPLGPLSAAGPAPSPRRARLLALPRAAAAAARRKHHVTPPRRRREGGAPPRGAARPAANRERRSEAGGPIGGKGRDLRMGGGGRRPAGVGLGLEEPALIGWRGAEWRGGSQSAPHTHSAGRAGARRCVESAARVTRKAVRGAGSSDMIGSPSAQSAPRGESERLTSPSPLPRPLFKTLPPPPGGCR